MHRRSGYIAVVVLALMIADIFGAGSVQDRPNAFLGVILDWRPLPEILTKHLGLAPGKGLRIENVFEGSPADRAGLDRDDILLSIDGQDVNDLREFGKAMAKAGPGKTVRLEVIHAGQSRTVDLTLVSRPEQTRPKYPPDPRAMAGWRVGGIFVQDPNTGRWVAMEDQQGGQGLKPPFPFPREVYTFQYGDDVDRVTVVVEGNPSSDTSKLTIKAGQQDYTTTVGQLDRLPERYQGFARQAIWRARRDSQRSRQFGPPRGQGRPGGNRPGREDELSAHDWSVWEAVIQRTLDGIAKYLESVDNTAGTMDRSQLHRLGQIEQQLKQLQERIDQIQQQQHNRQVP